MEDNKQTPTNKNNGYLYKNKKKNKQNQPDFTGKLNWKGEEISVSAWEKVSPSGEVYLSLAGSEKFVPSANTSNTTQNSPTRESGAVPTPNRDMMKKPQNTADLPGNDLDDLNSLFE